MPSGNLRWPTQENLQNESSNPWVHYGTLLLVQTTIASMFGAAGSADLPYQDVLFLYIILASHGIMVQGELLRTKKHRSST